MLRNYDNRITLEKSSQRLPAVSWLGGAVREMMKQDKHRTQFNTPTISGIVVTHLGTAVLGLSGVSTLKRGESRWKSEKLESLQIQCAFIYL